MRSIIFVGLLFALLMVGCSGGSTGGASNTAPVAIAQSLTMDEDTIQTITLAATDSDGDALIYSIITQPTHGVLSGTLPNLIYTPISNYYGYDIFTFKVNDGRDDSTVVNIYIKINDVEEPNHAPVMIWIPKTAINIYNLYQSMPQVIDIDGDTLSFSIQNKPSWAVFDTSTGLLQGKPTIEGNYTDIIVSVSDGDKSVSFSPFDIEVKPAQNIAHLFGKAIQGGTYGNSLASYAIDDNISTFNHTTCNAIENWWQVQLPEGTEISKVVVHNRGGQTARLNGTKVYIGHTDYNGTIISTNLIETLTGSSLPQVFGYTPFKKGSYLLLKADGSNCLHTPEVEIYGVTPPKPSFTSHKSSYLIPITSVIGYEITTLNAIDYQGDTITYSIDNSTFSIDSSGHVKVNATLQSGTYNVVVTISDGINFSTTSLAITVTERNAVEDALSSGRVDFVTEEELLTAARIEIAALRMGESLLDTLYKNDGINYTPSNNSQLLSIWGDPHKVFSILDGNNQHTLAVAGEKVSSHFALFGSNPMEYFQDGKNLEYQTPFKRLLSWLLKVDNNNLESAKSVALSFTPSTDKIESWIKTNLPNWSLKQCNDISSLASCQNGVDLIIGGDRTDVANAQIVQQELNNSISMVIPLLYVHPNWGYSAVTDAIGKLFGVSFPYGGNWWANDKALWNNRVTMQASTYNKYGYDTIDTMLAHFQIEDYSFDWSRCRDSKGNIGAIYDKCEDVVGLNSEFQLGATRVKSIMNILDINKKNVFATDGYRLQKLLALIGDKFRHSVVYPMDKVTTNDNEFMKSYYADHAVYNYRTIDPVQTDMGDFSRSDFSHITPMTRIITMISKKPFRSTGAYALPGQTVKITRLDSNSSNKIKVFINPLRSASTHQYQPNGYSRPKYLQTVHIEIKVGDTISLTSPYGGPIELSFDTNDIEVKLKFENVGEHPYWAFWESDIHNNSFATKLEDGEYDWAELVTSGFEVHSKLDKMVQSIDGTSPNWNWNTAENLAAATVKYTSNYPLVLAGFKGLGIDVVDEIHDFATKHKLTVETIEQVKHMNADHATCGYGCSGNPYDAYWAFGPIAHGDLHEIGHGLEKSRFRAEGFETHSSTNPYSYYTKSKYNEITGGIPECQHLPFKDVFEKLQASVNETNATAYLKANLWDTSDWSRQFMLTLQAMMHTQKMGKLTNGWHLLARLHILERDK